MELTFHRTEAPFDHLVHRPLDDRIGNLDRISEEQVFLQLLVNLEAS